MVKRRKGVGSGGGGGGGGGGVKYRVYLRQRIENTILVSIPMLTAEMSAIFTVVTLNDVSRFVDYRGADSTLVYISI